MNPCKSIEIVGPIHGLSTERFRSPLSPFPQSETNGGIPRIPEDQDKW
jgi:hypothetical protein